MNYVFLPEAESEFYDAIVFFEDNSEGLGLEFSREVFISMQRIPEFPLAWTEFENDTRRCLTGRFPFCIIYRIDPDEIVIVAVMQLNREPGYWKKRIA